MLEMIKEIGAWLDRIAQRSERQLKLHTEASAAVRNAFTETKIFLSSSSGKSVSEEGLADIARMWTDVSTKVQTLAHATNSDELRSLAGECMALADKCASFGVPEEAQVERIFRNATQNHDFAQKPRDYAREAQEHLLQQLSEDFKRRARPF